MKDLSISSCDAASETNEIPYQVIVKGRAIFEDPESKTARELVNGDIRNSSTGPRWKTADEYRQDLEPG